VKRKLTTSKIICSKCKTPKKTQKKQIERLISRFGSLELVHEKYHCIECRKKYNVRRDGKAKPIVKKRIKKKRFGSKLPEWMVNMNEDKHYTYSKRSFWKRPQEVSKEKWKQAIKEVFVGE